MRIKLRTVQYRRKRQGKTNYNKRRDMLKTDRARVVVRPTLKNIIVQVIQYQPTGDKVLVGLTSQSLDKLGWVVHKGNLPAAYLTGYLLGKKAVKQGVTEAVLDTGLLQPVKGSKIYACVKGMRDAGVDVPVDEEVLPSEERIRGEHIASYAKDNTDKFTDYAHKKVAPSSIASLFEKVKKAIEAHHEK